MPTVPAFKMMRGLHSAMTVTRADQDFVFCAFCVDLNGRTRLPRSSPT